MVNGSRKSLRYLWVLLPCATVLCAAASLRGAEYDEQYTLFLTAGMPRPAWPAVVFPAGLAREWQSGTADFGTIARDLRATDVHPPLYFWLVSLWRGTFGPDLFAARLLSVLLGLGALALIGAIASRTRIPPVPAMLLTLGCYGFAYTSVVARGFALAQMLLLAGVLGLLIGRRPWHFLLAGACLGAATLSNYLAMFDAGACLLARTLDPIPGRTSGRTLSPLDTAVSWRSMLGAIFGFLIFIPGDLWWFLAQRGSRQGQFPPFSLGASLARLAVRFTGDILGGLPLYVHGVMSFVLTSLLAILLVVLLTCIVTRWRRIGMPEARRLFALAALAPAAGLLLLGAVFNNTPIEVRYLTFATPFAGLLLAGALGWRGTIGVLLVQSASIAGLMLAPQTMQPGRDTARAAAAFVGDGIVLLPRGNDGVGVVGAFAIEAPPALPLLLIPVGATPAQILRRVRSEHRIVLALPNQDEASRAAGEAMRQAFRPPVWGEVARAPGVAVYERIGAGE